MSDPMDIENLAKAASEQLKEVLSQDIIVHQLALIGVLEAKLEKAVEALGRIASNEFAGVMLPSMPPQDAAAHFARTTLAELTNSEAATKEGGKDE